MAADHAGDQSRGPRGLQIPQAHLRARTAVHPPRGHFAGGRAARSIQLSLGSHAARGGIHLAGLRRVSRNSRCVLVPLAAGHRGVARRARVLHYPTDVLVGALFGAIFRRASVRRSSDAECSCSFPTSTSRASTASPLRSAPSGAISRSSASRPRWSRRPILGARRHGPSDRAGAFRRCAARPRRSPFPARPVEARC